jgi:hypothetical protein
MRRVPHGYADPVLIAQDLAAGGFTVPPRFDRVEARSVAESARVAAIAYCQGTPVRSEIEARGGPEALEAATQACAAFIEQRFGAGAVDGKIQALVVEVEK